MEDILHKSVKEAPDEMAWAIGDSLYSSSKMGEGKVRVTDRRDEDGVLHLEDNIDATTLGVHCSRLCFASNMDSSRHRFVDCP